jgi:hypothetical protein
VANDWYDRALKKSVNCVSDTSVKTIGSSSKFGMASPHFLETTTISDQLKLTYPEAKVIFLTVRIGLIFKPEHSSQAVTIDQAFLHG